MDSRKETSMQHENDREQPGEPSLFPVFMASRRGRAIRLSFGVALLIAALAVGMPFGVVLAGFALLPITTGLFNLCPIAPAWGGHFFGARYCAARPRSK